MIRITLVTWLLLFAAVCTLMFAIYVLRRGLEAIPRRLLSLLSERCDELEGTIDKHEAAILNLRARLGMQTLREKRAAERAGEIPPIIAAGIQSDDEKARARRELGAKLAAGVIKPIGR